MHFCRLQSSLVKHGLVKVIDKLGQVYIYNIRHQSSSRVLVGDIWKASLISVENEQCQ